MVTAVDSSVILDVLLDDNSFAPMAILALQTAATEGSLILCETVIAEIMPALGRKSLEEMLSEWNLTFSASTLDSAQLAGELFQNYLRRGGKRGRIVADFLIAAHAQVCADRLLARDRGFYRDYFRDLRLLDPASIK